jgi:hypothetical protein
MPAPKVEGSAIVADRVIVSPRQLWMPERSAGSVTR